MKQQNKILLFVAAAAAALIVRKKSQQSGVGATINPYKAISELQRMGVDFGRSFWSLSDEDKRRLQDYGLQIGYKATKAALRNKTYSEAFYNSLMRVYNKAVSGVGYVSEQELQDAKEYPIYDGNGRIAVIYRDRDDFPALSKFLSDINYIESNGLVKDATEAYWITVSKIAGGQKFVWSGKKNGKEKSSAGLKEFLFASRGESSGERKKRISILASEQKGGIYPEKLAEQMSWNGDYSAAIDGVQEALMQVETAAQAKQLLREAGYKRLNELTEQYDQETSIDYSDVPF